MQRSRILLLRHAETSAPDLGVHLDAVGEVAEASEFDEFVLEGLRVDLDLAVVLARILGLPKFVFKFLDAVEVVIVEEADLAGEPLQATDGPAVCGGPS